MLLTVTRPTLLWICVQDFERSRAFSFLNEVKKRFQTTYGSRAQTALPYAMNSEFSSTLAAQMVRDNFTLHFPHSGSLHCTSTVNALLKHTPFPQVPYCLYEVYNRFGWFKCLSIIMSHCSTPLPPPHSFISQSVSTVLMHIHDSSWFLSHASRYNCNDLSS